MRSVDRSIGPAVCFLLTLVVKLVRLFKPPHRGPVQDVRRILFVKPAEMGSTVLTYPTLLRARQLWPDCEIYFLVFAENTQAVGLLNIVPPGNIYEIRSDGLLHFFQDCFRMLVRLRHLNLDVAVDLEFFSRAAAILGALVGARATVGFERYTNEGLYKGDMMTHPVQYNCHIHVAGAFLSLIEALAQPEGQVPLAKAKIDRDLMARLPDVAAQPEERARILELVRSANPAVRDDSRLIILNVNSSDLMPLRRWPLANFIELGKRLLQDPSVFIVLTGVPSEHEESLAVVRQLGTDRYVNLVGQTSLRDLLVLYRLCDLLVTNDSGPSHFAALTDLPTVTLFGPETPELYGPLKPKRVALTAGLACSPCVSAYNHRRSPCNDNVCMRAISVGEVYDTCGRLLRKA